MSTARSSRAYDVLIKLLVCGGSGGGKSCLLMRFCDDTFTTSFITTIGIDFRIKTLLIGGLRVKCQVWDTAGQERFRVITNAYYRGAHGVLLVYDVTDQASFDDIGNWVKNIETCADASVRCILVGNKCDMSTDRLVSTERGQALADSFGIKFFETSAKTGMQVNECFTTLTQDILDTRKSKEGQDSGSGSIGIVPLSHPLHKDTRTKCCK